MNPEELRLLKESELDLQRLKLLAHIETLESRVVTLKETLKDIHSCGECAECSAEAGEVLKAIDTAKE